MRKLAEYWADREVRQGLAIVAGIVLAYVVGVLLLTALGWGG